MPTGTITNTVSIAGMSFSGSISRTDEGTVSVSVPLPAGVSGAISAAGVDGLATGHGISASDVIDVHWADPTTGDRKCRYGITVDTDDTNLITFDNDPAAAGDTLPAEDTAVVVSVQVPITMAFDGDDMAMIAAQCTTNSKINFIDSGAASLCAITLLAGEAWAWASQSSYTRPITGNAVATVNASNGSTTAGTLKIATIVNSL